MKNKLFNFLLISTFADVLTVNNNLTDEIFEIEETNNSTVLP